MLIKMCSMQIVFLFDLSACKDYLSEPKKELNSKLLSFRLACVRLLTDFSSKTSNFKWGFKFFDSSGSITQTMCKFAFSDVSLEAFETLENEICVRYERHIALLQALGASEKSVSSTNNISKVERAKSYPVKILQFALTQILCEFQWESMDMWSPSTRKFKDKSFFVGKKNFVFLFSDFKDNDKMLFQYFGLNSLPSKQKLLNTLLPQALRDSLLQKADIHLIFLNTYQNQKFMDKLSSNTLPLLSESLRTIRGSMIPLCLLSQPLYNMQILNNSENTLNGSEVSATSDLYSSFHNSIMPFSSLFQQSLYHSFYSKENSLTDKCHINVVNEDVKIPIQVMTIFNKNDNLNEDVKKKCSPHKTATWSKFIIQSAVSRSILHAAFDMLLCLPNDSKSDASEVGLMKLNRSLCLEGVNLLLECVMDNGTSMPGLLTPVSTEAAVISILSPPVKNVLLKSDCKNSAFNSLKVQNIEMENNSCKIQKIKTEFKTSFSEVKNTQKFEDSPLKSFQIECMEAWFKPTPSVFNLASYIQSKSSNKTSKVRSFYKMLQQSARNSKKLNSKLSKKHLIAESSTNCVDNNKRTGEELPGSQFSSETENIDLEEISSDLSYENLLSTVRNIYDSAIEESGNVVSSSKRIVKLVMSYYKKQNTTCLEEDVQNVFKNNFMMTARKISEKYELSDSEETTKKKIKECQIQILLILEIENSKKCPDRPTCVCTVSSLLRLMVFCSGIQELGSFTRGTLINYSPHLYDILVEIGDELSISIFDDGETANSPTETVSSELMIEEDLFSSAMSSSISEKSTSSISSRKDKDNNAAERKLVRHRSDISVTARCRQVILPRSASKKKKRKAAASKSSKSVRCSPRLALRKKEEHTRAASEKQRTVRRNLFPGSGQTPKKNKNNQPSTPKSKKRGSHISKTKYVAETPSHKQSHSALQRRKSFIKNSSDSPKVIAESPEITKTVKDGANKELLEKLQKAKVNLTKPVESSSQVSSCASVIQHTPESKRRLSLKLFSKVLASPTARMGIKKCTKRLFDQISPMKDGENCNKRHKPDSESE